MLAVGNLTSTEVDITVHYTSGLLPTLYTLQGVPILNYTITINPDIGSESETFSSSTVEYLYRPDALGESYTIEVTALNQAGAGAGSDITVNTPTSGNMQCLCVCVCVCVRVCV